MVKRVNVALPLNESVTVSGALDGATAYQVSIDSALCVSGFATTQVLPRLSLIEVAVTLNILAPTMSRWPAVTGSVNAWEPDVTPDVPRSIVVCCTSRIVGLASDWPLASMLASGPLPPLRPSSETGLASDWLPASMPASVRPSPLSPSSETASEHAETSKAHAAPMPRRMPPSVGYENVPVQSIAQVQA
jgi:hypothetical protein